MYHHFIKIFRRKKSVRNTDIDPDEIFLDSQNLPDFNTHQFEGRIEKPISRGVFGMVTLFIMCVGLIFTYKLWSLQIVEGESFRTRSDNNSLHQTLIYANRGVIYDRNGTPIVWNTISDITPDYSLRVYATSTGLSNVLGYIKYPSKDSSGFYYQTKFDPKDGLEKVYDDIISGENGSKIVETDVRGNVISESVVDRPKGGQNLELSIDLRLQRKMNEALLEIANRAGYKGGSGIIMDVRTGEILVAGNFPEYDSQVMTDGTDKAKIKEWLNAKNTPFLNRALNGLYTPGSIVKPFVAMGVLAEGVINPNTKILSTGSITIPNPFFPDKPSVFVDWKAHGLVDLRRAIAVSSNVYFYEVGGGYRSQPGIGILNIEKYTGMFGFGSPTGINFPGERSGTVPNPTWKAKNFNGDDWRVGDTYNTAIGQYGFQASPIQVVRAVAALANEGTLLTPTFIKSGSKVVPEESEPKISGRLQLNPNHYKIVKEGMRMGVAEGTSQAINFPFVKVASKTGTAQLGVLKDEVNSWVVGFWPYEDPKYAFTIVMERGSKFNQFGAVLVMKEFLEWVNIYAPEYLE